MLDVRIKVRLLLFQARCPSCSSSDLVTGLIRPWVEGPLFRSWLFPSLRRPFLCRDCDERFYDFRFKARLLTSQQEDLTSMLENDPSTSAPESSPAVVAKQGRTA